MGKLAVAVIVVVVSACRAGAQEQAPARDYGTIRASLEAQRAALAKQLDADPKRTLARARAVLVETLRDELLPAWNGTAWAMNGTSVTPQQGAIACGYFISTTLLHAGFEVERRRLGMQASHYIAKTLITNERNWKSSDMPIEQFVEKLRRGGDGIYLVGLDNHVGFVIVDGDDTWFHHSGPGDGVRREPALTASFLSTSRYREAVKLFEDALVEKWLRKTPIATVARRPRSRTR